MKSQYYVKTVSFIDIVCLQREDALAEAYSRSATEWLKRVERIEQGQKRKAKDARNREFFEKVRNPKISNIFSF